MEKVKILDADFPTSAGLVYPAQIVKSIVRQVNFAANTSKTPIQVVSEYRTEFISPNKIVGAISSAEMDGDSLVVSFEKYPSILNGYEALYDWSIEGFCWFRDTLKPMPTVIGYTGPTLFEVQQGFTIVCFLRKPKVKVDYSYNTKEERQN